MRPVALALGMMLTAPAAFAATGHAGIAYVQYGRLTSQAPQVRASRRLVQKEFAPKRKKIVQLQSKFERLRKQIRGMGPGTNPLQRSAALEKFRHVHKALKQSEQQYETGLHLRENQLQASFRKVARKEIAAYAQKHGFRVVLRAGVHYASASVDITDAILARLKRDFHKVQASDKGHK